MTTLRESLVAEIAKAKEDAAAVEAAAKAKVTELETRLSGLETSFVAILEKDYEEVKTLWSSLASHFTK
jgi:hypothetical protein